MTTVLIVDDNEPMRRVIRKIIGDLAEELYECQDGAEAVTLYSRHKPDWVLMDIRMHGMSGLEATRHITSSYPQARIVIVTDYDDPDLREAARQAGACRYINKRSLIDLRSVISS
jgi:two-component system response regulator DegU